MSLLSVAGFIACKDASCFEAFSCPWTSPSTFYKLLEIERRVFALVTLASSSAKPLNRKDNPEHRQRP